MYTILFRFFLYSKYKSICERKKVKVTKKDSINILVKSDNFYILKLLNLLKTIVESSYFYAIIKYCLLFI